jgi:uncharacterized ion transporter superfamily protein YfcC
MKRRIYKLGTKFTMLGLDPADWGILFGTFAASLQLFQGTGNRLSLLIAIVCTAIVFFIWHLVKDKVPEKFMNHLFTWLGEPEVYKVVQDTRNVPLVVDFKQLNKADKQTSSKEKSWRMPSGRSDSWL